MGVILQIGMGRPNVIITPSTHFNSFQIVSSFTGIPSFLELELERLSSH